MQHRSRAVACVVIEREHHAIRRKDAAAAHRGEVVERHRSGAVGAHGAIYAADDHVAGARVAPGLRGKDLLADGLALHGGWQAWRGPRYWALLPPPGAATRRPGMSASA